MVIGESGAEKAKPGDVSVYPLQAPRHGIRIAPSRLRRFDSVGFDQRACSSPNGIRRGIPNKADHDAPMGSEYRRHQQETNMPTYEYECQRCGVMDVFQSIKDDPLTRCPECASRRFRRRVCSGAGVIFRGSGFFETDYNRSSDYQKQAQSETASASDAATGAAAAPPAAQTASSTPAPADAAT